MPTKPRFSGCNVSLEEAKCVILGTWLYREGENNQERAPEIVRKQSKNLEDYHLLSGLNYSDLGLHDGGNLTAAVRGGKEGLEEIYQNVLPYVNHRKMVFTIGEEREITYVLLKAFHEKYEHLKVVTVDAYHGFETGENEPISENNYLHHCVQDFLPKENIWQLGIRCGSKESYKQGVRKHRHLPPRVKKGIIERLPKLYNGPVYVSLNLNVLEPCLAPGVKKPVFCGISVVELIETLRYFESVPVVGFDIMGLDFTKDQGNLTALLVCTLVKEALIYFTANNQYVS